MTAFGAEAPSDSDFYEHPLLSGSLEEAMAELAWADEADLRIVDEYGAIPISTSTFDNRLPAQIEDFTTVLRGQRGSTHRHP